MEQSRAEEKKRDPRAEEEKKLDAMMQILRRLEARDLAPMLGGGDGDGERGGSVGDGGTDRMRVDAVEVEEGWWWRRKGWGSARLLGFVENSPQGEQDQLYHKKDEGGGGKGGGRRCC